jgi:hypothetical protein
MSVIHGSDCVEDPCDYCQEHAEAHAADIEPDYDVEAAENSYERYQYGEPA